MVRSLLLGVSVAALLPGAAAARLTPVPLGNGSVIFVEPTPTPIPTPALPTTPRPTLPPVVLPTPDPPPTSTPRTSASPPRAAARPVAAAPARARAAEPEASRATPTPTPAPTSAPAPIETVVLNPAPAGMPLWPWLAGGAVVLLLLALVLLRRRGEPAEEEYYEHVADQPVEMTIEPVSAADPLPAAEPVPAAPVPAGLAQLTLDVRAVRAGLNLLTATVEVEVTVTVSNAAAADIRAAVTLIGARGDIDPDLHALAAQPIGRPAVPPFALDAGVERRFRAVAALPIGAIDPLTAGGRPMFVPLVVVSVQWTDGERDRRTTRGFAIGIERTDSAKLGPLWLDVPPRSYDAVAARPHEPVLEG